MSEYNPQETAQDQATAQAPEKKSFFTPFTCCLGCGGFGIVVIGLLAYFAYYLYTNALDENPIPITMPPVAEATVDAMEGKVKALASGDQPTASFSADEINALLQKKLLPHIAKSLDIDVAQCKAVYALTADDKVDVKLSYPVFSRFLNFQFIGKVAVEKGELTFSDVDKAQVGQFNKPKEVRSYIAQSIKDKETLKDIDTLTIANGQVTVTLVDHKPAEGAAVEKPADPGGAKEQVDPEGADKKTPE